MMKSTIHVLRLQGISIFKQLQIEEALLRTCTKNWLIWNEKHPEPTIVLGISGKPDVMLNTDLVKRNQIPLIKRFTGGGTVIVDKNTIFTSFIMNIQSLPHVKPYPRQIMDWTGSFYKSVFDKIMHQKGNTQFSLREDDYVFGDKKFAGNAQSITKQRWIHHTSFLWDYDPENMNYLRNPSKQPKYREFRDHDQFLCKLIDFIPHSKDFYENIIHFLKEDFEIEYVELEHIEHNLSTEHRKTTQWIQCE